MQLVSTDTARPSVASSSVRVMWPGQPPPWPTMRRSPTVLTPRPRPYASPGLPSTSHPACCIWRRDAADSSRGPAPGSPGSSDRWADT